MSSRSDRYLEQEFMRPDGLQHPVPKNPSAALDRRHAERVSLSSCASYSIDENASRRTGRLLNLSITGCRIAGVSPAVGTSTAITLELGDGNPSVVISGATVCWKQDDSFGVQFPPLAVEVRQRVKKCVLKFLTLQGASEEHVAFRFA
jgi:hypothetical protein